MALRKKEAYILWEGYDDGAWVTLDCIVSPCLVCRLEYA